MNDQQTESTIQSPSKEKVRNLILAFSVLTVVSIYEMISKGHSSASLFLALGLTTSVPAICKGKNLSLSLFATGMLIYFINIVKSLQSALTSSSVSATIDYVSFALIIAMMLLSTGSMLATMRFRRVHQIED